MISFEIISNIIAAVVILLCYSIVIKPNIAFEWVSTTYIGVAVSVTVVTSFLYASNNIFGPIMSGNVIALIGLILGLLMLTSLSKTYAWISRIPMAIAVGSSTTYVMRVGVETYIMTPLSTLVKTPLFTTDILSSLNNLLISVGWFTVIFYFVFTKKIPKFFVKPMALFADIGRLFILAMLGASFGNTAMGRATLLIGRLKFVLEAFFLK